MKKIFKIIFLFALFLLVFYVSYTKQSGVEFDRVFVTLATFLFSIFTGFFISNQNSRYGKIRDAMAQLDGKLSGIYRASMHFGHDMHTRVGEIITKNYEAIIASNTWDYNFTHKSTTITDIHTSLEEYFATQEKPSEIQKQALARVTSALMDLQSLRKQVIALREERIPLFQWVLVVLFAATLLITVFSLPSQGFLIGSILKGAFAVSIVSVIFILRSFDDLEFFEGRIGEHSAEDVLGIIKGEK